MQQQANGNGDDAMYKTMSPSDTSITRGQAGKFADIQVAALIKSGLPSEPTQIVLEQQGGALASEFVDLVRKRVEALSGIRVRRVNVNRNRTAQEALDATSRKQYTDRKVVNNMPKGEGEGVEIVFFKLDLSERNGYISDEGLEKEFELHGLKPADPISVAAVNEDDPAFADDHPNATHWKNSNGKYCFAAFGRWSGERSVHVIQGVIDWDDYWWFAGVRK